MTTNNINSTLRYPGACCGVIHCIFRLEDFMKEEKEKLVRTSVYLEEEVMEALGEAAREFEKQTGMKWSKGAVIRVALSDFFTRRGKIL